MSATALLQLAVAGLLAASGPLAYAWVRSDGDRYRKLVWIATFLTFDLILFGAFTRLTDSGLGCPDWPGCYGHSNPIAAKAHIDAAQAAMPTGPVTVSKAWIEMTHRYFAMGVGVLIMTMMAIAWVRRASLRRSPWPATGLFVLVCLQGAFGAWTVTLKLMPAIVTLHLLLGIALLCALGAFGAREQARAPEQLRTLALLALAVVFAQIALGGWVSTNYAVLACQDFPLCNGALVPQADFARGFDLTRPLGMNDDGSLLPVQALVAIHWVHRVSAIAVVLVVSVLIVALARAGGPMTRIAWTLAGLLSLQIASGVSNILFAWPLAVAVVHTGGAAALALSIAMLCVRVCAPLHDGSPDGVLFSAARARA